MTQSTAQSRSDVPRRLRWIGTPRRHSDRAPATADARLPAGRHASERLTALFVAEPELIRAYTEPGSPSMGANIDTILAAALEAADAHPDFADLQYFTARAALRLGRTHEAEALLARALALNPYYVEALILAAQVAQAVGDADRAITCLKRALAAGADYPDVHLMLANLWRACGDVTLARQARSRSQELKPTLDGARKLPAKFRTAGVREGRG